MNRRMNSDDPMSMAMAGMSFLRDSISTGQQIGENRYQADERDGVNKAYEYVAGKLGNSGDISQLDGDPILNTRHGTMGVGKFMTDRASTETSRLQMLKAMEASDDQFYQKTFRPMAFAAQDAFKAGDMSRFAGIASELSAKTPMPYRLIHGQDGNFDVEFRSDSAGGWTRTNQRLTPQEAMAEIDNILGGEQTILAGADMKPRPVNARFLAASARYKMGTILGNAEALADPKKWIPMTKGGRTVYVIPQNRIDNYSVGPSYRILDEKGGTSAMVESMDDLLSQGFVRADVKADTQNKQRIAAGKGVGGGSGGAVNAKIGPKSGDVHRAMLAAGHAWVPEQGWYYAVTIDEEGKARADLSKPAKQEMYNAILSRNKAGGASNSNDPMGILAALQSNLKTHSAQSNIPTPAPAPATTQQQPAQGNNTEPPVPHPSWNDLTREEQAHWEKTGRLPAKFGQVR